MKALREQQRSRLDGRHKYITGLVALQVGLTGTGVEDYLLDGNQVIQNYSNAGSIIIL
jgi:hypothetical protein